MDLVNQFGQGVVGRVFWFRQGVVCQSEQVLLVECVSVDRELSVSLNRV